MLKNLPYYLVMLERIFVWASSLSCLSKWTLGFKYLGYHLTPLGCGINDRRWILKIFENKIRHWSFRLLSLGGILMLTHYVLFGVLVYWFLMAKIR